MTAYLDESLRNKSFCATGFHITELIAVCLGMHALDEPVATVTLRVGSGSFRVVGGKELYAKFRAAKDDAEKTTLAFNTILSQLTPELFERMMEAQYEQGKREGHAELRQAFNNLMNYRG